MQRVPRFASRDAHKALHADWREGVCHPPCHGRRRHVLFCRRGGFIILCLFPLRSVALPCASPQRPRVVSLAIRAVRLGRPSARRGPCGRGSRQAVDSLDRWFVPMASARRSKLRAAFSFLGKRTAAPSSTHDKVWVIIVVIVIAIVGAVVTARMSALSMGDIPETDWRIAPG